MPIAKDTLGLAGEFAVASELCRRGIYAQLTLGHRKRTDLLLEGESGMIRVQVKAKQGREWPASKGVHGNHMVLVFVDYQNIAINERPKFYVLGPEDWRKVVKVALVDSGKVALGLVQLDEHYVPKFKDGWIGMSLRANQVAEFKDRWETISAMVQDLPTPSASETMRTTSARING